ncbi:patched domain-containing protein 3 [Eurytemora carolleeae]|uniref:patched domain-containing protein 3 n=1 Tax=Eurytemora carolleeae TaxID=1294199 RepID=UPI000C76CB3B|nr:patched domain-containing protein 3 [Eurytemora carolleeae]|eukprot:XP_023326651.1 patched domain-containing protein 3-like [Eurytemora affinis]
MRRMGPAVFNGGISTLLAFILLATSSSYVFLSFFKIFFLICIFGLFHGLISLPVILSLVGPINQGRRREKVDTGSEFQDTQH